jgi:hypothetical protein
MCPRTFLTDIAACLEASCLCLIPPQGFRAANDDAYRFRKRICTWQAQTRGSSCMSARSATAKRRPKEAPYTCLRAATWKSGSRKSHATAAAARQRTAAESTLTRVPQCSCLTRCTWPRCMLAHVRAATVGFIQATTHQDGCLMCSSGTMLTRLGHAHSCSCYHTKLQATGHMNAGGSYS